MLKIKAMNYITSIKNDCILKINLVLKVINNVSEWINGSEKRIQMNSVSLLIFITIQ